MTIEEVQRSSKLLLSANDIAPIIGADPQSIRMCARECPMKLGFPVMVIGVRTHIPRLPFLHWLGLKGAEE